MLKCGQKKKADAGERSESRTRRLRSLVVCLDKSCNVCTIHDEEDAQICHLRTGEVDIPQTVHRHTAVDCSSGPNHLLSWH